MRIPEDVLKCVVFLGVGHVEEGIPPMETVQLGGTGFFVVVPWSSVPDAGTAYLVTARHVADRLHTPPHFIRVNTQQDTWAFVPLSELEWWVHPTDPTADVAVAPLAFDPEQIDFRGVTPDMFWDDSTAKDQGSGLGDEIFIIGLFAHLSGQQRNQPIVRTGTIAMMPDEPIPTEQGPMEAFLIEARSIGGMSGSPVFVRVAQHQYAFDFYLAGLVHGHWIIPPTELNNGMSELQGDAEVAINMGITTVVPASKIRETLDQAGLREMRDQSQRDHLAQRQASSRD